MTLEVTAVFWVGMGLVSGLISIHGAQNVIWGQKSFFFKAHVEGGADS